MANNHTSRGALVNQYAVDVLSPTYQSDNEQELHKISRTFVCESY